MAKKEKSAFQYGDEIKKLRAEGPGRLYLLRGEEDFLRDSYLRELRALCVEEGTEAFNYHRLQGADLDLAALAEAVEAMPFMGERTLVEVRDFDVNRTKNYDHEALKELVSDLPDWTTLAFVFAPGYAPDNRLGVVKAMKKLGVDLEFTAPREAELIRWVARRAQDQGKRIEPGTASYLLWICGNRMNTLIPEIVKIAGAAAGEEITRADIDTVAKRAPETTIFDLTDALGERKYDRAASLLADLLADRDEPPQLQIAMISEQFRRLLAAKVAADHKQPDSFITDCIPELAGRNYPLGLVKRACSNYSASRLAHAVELCADCDQGMKSGGPAPEEQLKELLLHLALDKA